MGRASEEKIVRLLTPGKLNRLLALVGTRRREEKDENQHKLNELFFFFFLNQHALRGEIQGSVRTSLESSALFRRENAAYNRLEAYNEARQQVQRGEATVSILTHRVHRGRNAYPALFIDKQCYSVLLYSFISIQRLKICLPECSKE